MYILKKRKGLVYGIMQEKTEALSLETMISLTDEKMEGG